MRRADLRELVADLAGLPEDQRGALVLFEMGDLSHREIAAVIGCAPEKVKALVFQARSALIAEREARETPCEDIRGQLAVGRAGALRRAPLRRHLRHCEPCTEFRLAVAGQRTRLALILPVAPSVGLKAAVLGGSGGGAAVAARRRSRGRRRRRAGREGGDRGRRRRHGRDGRRGDRRRGDPARTCEDGPGAGGAPRGGARPAGRRRPDSRARRAARRRPA